MFVNHTSSNLFDEFENKYKERIYAHYPHVRNLKIHCLYIEEYLELENVPIFDNLDNDTFAFSCYRNEISDEVQAFILYSLEVCESMDLNNEEKEAAIAHEVGHIIHYFNESLNNVPPICKEIKSDEVVGKLGLSQSLISVLNKLIHSNKYSENQCNEMRKRILFLNA